MSVKTIRTRRIEYHVQTDEKFTDQNGVGEFSPTIISVEEENDMEKELENLNGNIHFWMHRGHESDNLRVLTYRGESNAWTGILREVWEQYKKDVNHDA